MAPNRLAPNAAVDYAVSLNRCANTTLAIKIGVNANTVAATNRTGRASDNNADCGTNQATAIAANSNE